MNSTTIINKLHQLPEHLKKEVSDFIDFLLTKKNEKGQQPGPKFGSGKGMFVMHDDFDKPLDDFKDYM